LVNQSITLCARGRQTVDFNTIVGRSALFIGSRNTYCCGPCGI